MSIIQSPFFSQFDTLCHGFTTRALPVRSPFYVHSERRGEQSAEEITENCRIVLQHVPMSDACLSLLQQVHGPEVAIITEENYQEEQIVDAQVTCVPGILLGILTADCVPVLFYDAEAQVVGAAHAGWKGTLAGVVGNTIQTMITLGAKPQHIHALIGPCIHQESYEVGPEVYEMFVSREKAYAGYFIPSARPNHYLLDLPGMVAHQLEDQSIGAFEALPENTYLNPDKWYSFRLSTHRQEPYPGSILSMIGLHNKR